MSTPSKLKCQKNKACVKQPANALPDNRPLCTGCDTKPKVKPDAVVTYHITKTEEFKLNLSQERRDIKAARKAKEHSNEICDLLDKVCDALETCDQGLFRASYNALAKQYCKQTECSAVELLPIMAQEIVKATHYGYDIKYIDIQK
jgi:hypothetical protein